MGGATWDGGESDGCVESVDKGGDKGNHGVRIYALLKSQER